MVDARKMRRFHEALTELNAQKMEPLAIYRPTPQQLPLHHSKASEAIVRGGKRSGKTVCVALEFASRVTGTTITGPDEQQIPLRFPVCQPTDPALYWIIGFNLDHIGQTIYHKLFSPGGLGFRVIPDIKTKQWRVYNPGDPADVARFAESLPSPPVIPPRLINEDSWAWEDKKRNIFKEVTLVNGARICAYPSTGDHAKQGDSVSGIWIDEDIANPTFLAEWQDRLTDKDGWFMWSVWPHMANYALVDVLDRAAECEGEEDPPIQAFQLLMTDNPYASEKGKEKALRRMGSEEEIARRNRGDLLLDELAMYDVASAIHLVKKKPPLGERPSNAHELICSLLERFNHLPQEWTRYLAIDPSHTRTAVLSGVVPPPEWEGVPMGERLIIEWELVVKKASAVKLADMLHPLMATYGYDAFVMDQNAGRQTWAGQDKTVFEHYTAAFNKKGLASRLTKSGFVPGCNDPPMRRRQVRELLAPTVEDGWPRLWLVDTKTPETQREFHTYRKKQQKISNDREEILDEPANPRKHDCMAALEYLVAYVSSRFADHSAFVEPIIAGHGGSPAYRAAMSLLARLEKQNAGYVHMGPGAAA